MTFQIGLNSLINAAIFVNSIFSPDNKNVAKQSDTFYGLLDIDEPPSATSSASLKISGHTAEYDTVDIYLNNIKVDSATPKSSGDFSKTIGSLRSGNNTIYFVANTANDKQEKKSDTYNVEYVSEPPQLEIESPADNAKVASQEIEVKGTTDNGVTLKLNNLPVVVDSQGNFKSSYRLKDGENKLELIATDIAGNETKNTLIVTREKDE
ncbi:hypothetical protein A3A93_04945 [Candidatus Roizmanbacteria bacterium RIFCSPLOWO2_01_FULL_38_12]|uniref:Bacterial Ig-like domain-containing protein n=1 Tax=Candidatus Roizmanbacteria bacterium RIFCSPLOWO2_01_FULL_38_12 TaxID=1802061 RepID=A0A1F7J0S6_9BACT|nr:MAG: hypothetical protein A2861_03395 [Candidatus Roizmanbacteria bacterium RIFCSPHIGHO2_01_FULL_38_15]OGK36201.1 MAG: hypothetical protein A3F59_04505 [Candidatus Roizmanbacteria bacterium RIFCSPHIGHO2_12_FULL_38_13]OGK49182.1 MAG: hypothetical protein A3A93_04945 [Candidatus Roizmanbacteria bacterium RIFCSPLOWO2_01_FULL_38_12]